MEIDYSKSEITRQSFLDEFLEGIREDNQANQEADKNSASCENTLMAPFGMITVISTTLYTSICISCPFYICNCSQGWIKTHRAPNHLDFGAPPIYM